MGAILILTMARSADFYLYAKNDGALAAAALIAAYFIIEKKELSPIKVGLLLGLLPAIKMNGIFISIPLGTIFILQKIGTLENLSCITST